MKQSKTQPMLTRKQNKVPVCGEFPTSERLGVPT